MLYNVGIFFLFAAKLTVPVIVGSSLILPVLTLYRTAVDAVEFLQNINSTDGPISQNIVNAEEILSIKQLSTALCQKKYLNADGQMLNTNTETLVAIRDVNGIRTPHFNVDFFRPAENCVVEQLRFVIPAAYRFFRLNYQNISQYDKRSLKYIYDLHSATSLNAHKLPDFLHIGVAVLQCEIQNLIDSCESYRLAELAVYHARIHENADKIKIISEIVNKKLGEITNLAD